MLRKVLGPGLVRNSALSLVSLGARVGANLVVLIIQARVLGPDTFGRYSFALAAAGLMSLVVDFGTVLRVLRTISLRPGDTRMVFRNDLMLRAAMLVPFYVMVAVFLAVEAKMGFGAAFLLIATAFIGNSTGEYGLAVLRALGRYEVEAGVVLVTSSVHLIVSIWVVLNFPALENVAGGFLVSRVFFALLVMVVVGSIIRRMPAGSSGCQPFWTNLRSAFPYAQDVVLANGMDQTDMILAGAFLGVTQLGLYAICNRLFQVLSQLMGALANVFIPDLSRAFALHSHFVSRTRHVIVLFLGLSVVIAAGVFLVAPLLTVSVLGDKYAGLDGLWPLVALAAAARTLAAGSAMPITAGGLQVWRVRVQMVGLPLLVAAGALGATRLGAAGLLVGVSVSYAAIAAMQFVCLHLHGMTALPSRHGTAA